MGPISLTLDFHCLHCALLTPGPVLPVYASLQSRQLSVTNASRSSCLEVVTSCTSSKIYQSRAIVELAEVVNLLGTGLIKFARERYF